MSLIGSNRRTRVAIRSVEGGYRLYRNDEAFFVKGAAGFEYVKELAEAGGNSLRTWGMDQTERVLPDIRRYGLTLCAGLWMVPPRQGFDYSDANACSAQFEELRQQVLRLASEPCLLVWGVGNELELGVSTTSTDVWREVEKIAALIKETDPFRPVMTVLASVNEAALRSIDTYCPSIDFVSFNSYGDLEGVQFKLDAIGWSRPYLVTEWGANGHWEVSQTAWGAEIEPTSTEKAAQIRRRYRSLDGTQGQCLGSYVFLWGNKQERTPTWYGLFDEEGRATESVDVISSLWTDANEEGTCPQISGIELAGQGAGQDISVSAGEWVEVSCKLSRGDILPESASWAICREGFDKKEGGDAEAVLERNDSHFEQLGAGRICFAAPGQAGAYRIFLKVRGPGNWIATANVPFRVEATAE